MSLYIGIVENNDWEGETFGYYVADTPKNREGLERIIAVLSDTSDSYEVELDGYTRKELSLIEKGAQNGYMPRVNFLAEPVDWQEIEVEIVNGNDPFYKGRSVKIINDWRACETTLARHTS